MITHWEILRQPGKKDPNRRRLLIDGDMDDMLAILKKLGNICARPQKAEPPYTYSVFILGADDKTAASVEKEIKRVISSAKTPAHKTSAKPHKKVSDEAKPPVSAEAQPPAVKPPEQTAGNMFKSFIEALKKEGMLLSGRSEAAKKEEIEIPLFISESKPAQPKPENVFEKEPKSFSEADISKYSKLELTGVEPMASQTLEKELKEIEAEISAENKPAPPAQKSDVVLVKPPPPKSKQTGRRPVQTNTISGIPIRKPEKPGASAETGSKKPLPPSVPPAPARKPSLPSVLRKSLFKTLRRPEGETSKKRKWSLELPLVPTYNFETFIVGNNRFAHAAGISVADSPGYLYNPLLIYGPGGAGKTHFLNAIGYKLSGTMGQTNIFVTDGLRLSRGTQKMISEGKIGAVDALMKNIKALLIDDIHLMAVSPENKKYISKWLNGFISEKRQIILTSAYPPKDLARLEASLDCNLSNGWTVEMRQAEPEHYKAIIGQMVDNLHIFAAEDEIQRLFIQPAVPFNVALKHMMRLKMLEKLLPSSKSPIRPGAMFEMIMGTNETSSNELPSAQEMEKTTGHKFSGSNFWGKLGCFSPVGGKAYADWAAAKIMEKSAELEINGSFELAFKYEYDSSNLLEATFKIADICDEQGVQGALIIGPAVEDAAAQDFFNVTRQMLDSMFVRCGCIENFRLKSPSAFLRLLLDLLR
ncbi:MAG: DnaA/Hda family protein [Elusimicrobia bacterium]|nr:DnaA/Hda family protein [Elusimicrobiota bacterium]